jgi:hypothetical protein
MREWRRKLSTNNMLFSKAVFTKGVIKKLPDKQQLKGVLSA